MKTHVEWPLGQPVNTAEPREKRMRYALGTLLGLMALNAFGGGYYGMAGAEGVPTEWLANSPFRNYFIPSLILFIGIGGSSLMAAVAVFRRWRAARTLALGAGILVLVWLSVQVAIIGYVSWMQPATATAGLLILILSWLLPAR